MKNGSFPIEKVYKYLTERKKMTINPSLLCTGCSACVSVCPVNALTMGTDEDGFYKPLLNADKCIDCHKCDNICPLNGVKTENVHTPSLYVFNNNSADEKLSATAGAFQILAKHFIRTGGKVAGAAWGENWRCEHILVDNEEDLKRLYKSKYVQSFMGDVFKQIKAELEKGTKILFSGVPCQIAGLYAFLGKAYDNLYTVGLLCNNAPSAKHFHDFLQEMYGIANIADVDFRAKDKNCETTQMILRIKLQNGTVFDHEIWSDGSYYQAFVNRMLVGKHCENCAFAHLPRIEDFTIGDIWGAEKVDDRFRGLKSQSVLINSPKGKELFNIIKENVTDMAPIPLQILINMHPVLQQKWPAHPSRDRAFDLLKKFPFQKACDQILHNQFDVGIVGVPTNPNFGGGLTYLALKWAVEDMGKTCLMISPPGSDLPWLPKRITNFKQNPYKNYELACYPSKEAMRELNYRCDMFLIGSDQLYSTHFPNVGIYGEMQEFPSLDWVWDSKKKSAYSASFGKDELICPQDMKNRMRYFLRKFDCFSVRERSAADLCKREFDMNVDFVLDPVFICDKKHWGDLISIGNKVNGIVTYVLDMNEEKQHIIDDVASFFKMPVHNIADATGKGEEAPLMEDWLAAFASADFIITDSFHGTCFATIFNKPFIVVANPNRGIARFRILEEFGLENRLLNTYNDFHEKKADLLKPVEWSSVNSKIDALKKSSLEFLQNAIQPIDKEVSEYDVLYEKIILEKTKINACLADFSKRIEKLESKKEIKKNIKLPKIIGKLICCFILKKKNRKHFRKKYMK